MQACRLRSNAVRDLLSLWIPCTASRAEREPWLSAGTGVPGLRKIVIRTRCCSLLPRVADALTAFQ
jgi:hypothetical protein